MRICIVCRRQSSVKFDGGRLAKSEKLEVGTRGPGISKGAVFETTKEK